MDSVNIPGVPKKNTDMGENRIHRMFVPDSLPVLLHTSERIETGLTAISPLQGNRIHAPGI